jgi:hypothetical protein
MVDTTYYKLIQSSSAAEHPEDCGFGWTEDDANDFMEQLVDPFWREAATFVSDDPTGYETPPLDHEDGCVYSIARDAGSEDYFYERFCLTRDVEFRNAELSGDIEAQNASVAAQGSAAAIAPPKKSVESACLS